MRIRDADFTKDRDAMLGFIMDSQHFEYAFEPNRRLDPPVAAEYLKDLEGDVARHGGRFLIAETDDGEPLGWAVVHEQDDPTFVIAEERRNVYISELYVEERARGTGIGRALIDACEAWAKERGILVMQIGVLALNTRADKIYRQAGYAPYAYQLRKYLK
jgi:GNAT superfamily N-acetyltransferase